MKGDHDCGLVSAGSASRSVLARMATLLARLGPVKASSFPVARRLVRSLKAGYAISHYSALEMCRMVWVFVPESGLDRVVRDLASQMPVRQTMIVFAESSRDSRWAAPLRHAGARVATLNAVEESNERLFIAEGHNDTLRELRRMLAQDDRKMIAIEPQAKPLYFAGVYLATHLLVPWLDASAGSLRMAGFERAEAVEVSQALVRKVLRMYTHAGYTAWSRTAARQLKRTLDRDLEPLRAQDAQLAEMYAEGIRMALARLQSREVQLAKGAT